MPKEKIQPKEENPFSNRKYIRAIGRRKSATATVKLYLKGQGLFFINRKPAQTSLPHFSLWQIVRSPLEQTGKDKEIDVAAKVTGGGSQGQAEAIRLGLARALVKLDEKLKPSLRQLGWLTVDARVKERKKPGLKRARRAPQWAKR